VIEKGIEIGNRNRNPNKLHAVNFYTHQLGTMSDRRSDFKATNKTQFKHILKAQCLLRLKKQRSVLVNQLRNVESSKSRDSLAHESETKNKSILNWPTWTHQHHQHLQSSLSQLINSELLLQNKNTSEGLQFSKDPDTDADMLDTDTALSPVDMNGFDGNLTSDDYNDILLSLQNAFVQESLDGDTIQYNHLNSLEQKMLDSQIDMHLLPQQSFVVCPVCKKNYLGMTFKSEASASVSSQEYPVLVCQCGLSLLLLNSPKLTNLSQLATILETVIENHNRDCNAIANFYVDKVGHTAKGLFLVCHHCNAIDIVLS